MMYWIEIIRYKKTGELEWQIYDCRPPRMPPKGSFSSVKIIGPVTARSADEAMALALLRNT